jgi:hypothetical protein
MLEIRPGLAKTEFAVGPTCLPNLVPHRVSRY